MNLWSDSGRKLAVEPESNPEIEEKPLHHKDMSNFSVLYHYLQFTLTQSFHEYKVSNLIKINESLE